MKILNLLNLLIQLNELILEENTGTPEMLAKKLKISKRQLFGKLQTCKSHNVDICYSKKRKTYYFNNGKGLFLSYVIGFYRWNTKDPDNRIRELVILYSNSTSAV